MAPRACNKTDKGKSEAGPEAAQLDKRPKTTVKEAPIAADRRTLRARRSVRGPRPGRATTGWDSLTRTEQKVVELVAQGLTNREVAKQLFVSPRTVETHLSHVFAKMGVSSRVQLAVAAARHTAGQPKPSSS